MRLDDGTTWHFQSSKDIKAPGRPHDLRPADWSNGASEQEWFALFSVDGLAARERRAIRP
jgi:hypothetical protein